MSTRTWTPQQRQAIEDRGGALLLSAAAGSGKTAVLTQRAVERLADENAADCVKNTRAFEMPERKLVFLRRHELLTGFQQQNFPLPLFS